MYFYDQSHFIFPIMVFPKVSNKIWVTTTAENKLKRIPKIKVKANPLIKLVPNK